MTAAPAGAVVVPSMGILGSSDATSVTLCAEGHAASAVNKWVFTIEGVKSDGSVVNVLVTGSGQTFNNCTRIGVSGTTAGAGTGTLSFAGSGPDVAGTFVAYWGWTPPTGTFAAGTGIT